MKKRFPYLLTLLLSAILFGCDNKEPVPVTEETIDFRLIDGEPAWSPDGEWIAYVHKDSILEKNGIYLIRQDGTDSYLWETYATSPTWSPDSKWIAFSKGGQIGKKKIGGDSLTQLSFEGRNFSPSWSPDGENLTYRRSYAWPETFEMQGLWKINLKTNEISQYFQGNSGEAEWLDNGDIFYIIGKVDDVGNLVGFYCCKINLKTLHQSKILFLPELNQVLHYNYLKCLNKIIFTSFKNAISSIWILDMSDNSLEKIIQYAYSANWSPCGKKIVYTDCRKTNGYLWIMDLNTKEKHQLTFNN